MKLFVLEIWDHPNPDVTALMVVAAETRDAARKLAYVWCIEKNVRTECNDERPHLWLDSNRSRAKCRGEANVKHARVLHTA